MNRHTLKHFEDFRCRIRQRLDASFKCAGARQCAVKELWRIMFDLKKGDILDPETEKRFKAAIKVLDFP
jgi:hypothetical protein